MGLGLGLLRLSPKDFWAMTPKELEAALAGLLGEAPAAPMSRAELRALMALYPDRERTDGGRD